MLQLPTRLAICVHEVGHAIVQLAHGSHPWIDSIAIDRLPKGILGPGGHTLDMAALQPWSGGWPRRARGLVGGRVARRRQLACRTDRRTAMRRYSRTAIWLGAEHAARRCMTETQEDFSDFGRVRFRLESAVPGDDHYNFVRAWLEAEEEVAHWWREIVELGRMLTSAGELRTRSYTPCGAGCGTTGRIVAQYTSTRVFGVD